MMKQRNFKEIYDKIYSKVGQSIEEKRKKVLRKKLISYVIAIILWAVVLFTFGAKSLPVAMILFVVTIIVLIIVNYKITKEYKRTYKEEIINEIVVQSSPDFKYDSNNGMSSSEYAASGFDHGWDRYHSEDMISGKMEDGSLLKMSQVHTEEEHESTDSDGHTTTTYVTTFLGLYGIIKLKVPTRADFMVRENSTFSKFSKKRIEMESSEFEKYYDVFSGSKKDNELRQNAMELLTPETIEQFVAIRNIFKQSINVRVDRDRIYFRIEVGDIFEPPTFKNSMDFEMLKKYFLIIDVPRMIYEAMIDNIIVMYGDSEARENRNVSNMSDSQKEEYLNKKKAEEESSYFSH